VRGAIRTRMSVLADGRFQCLGSTQHLEAKFGEGYSNDGNLDSECFPLRLFVTRETALFTYLLDVNINTYIAYKGL